MLPDWLGKSRAARLWRRLGITYKFGLAFTLLLGMVVVAAVVNLTALAVVQEAEDDILASQEIRQKVFEMDAGLEKSRRLYRDFLINYPEIGFTRAQELFGQPALAATAKVIAVNEDLRRLVSAANVSEALRLRNVDLTLYLSLAKRYSTVLLENMTLLSSLADPAEGLESRLSARMASLKTALSDSRSFSFMLQEADLFEKQYRITRQRPSMQSAFNLMAKLNQRVADSSDLSQEIRKHIQGLVGEYVAIASRILETDVAIRGNFNDFNLQANTVDPISQELQTLASAEVARFQKRINWVSRAALATILTTTIIGMVCAFGIAFVINASVTRKIVDMTSRASELRSGNLEVTVEAGSGDELGVLADTFNAMTHRVRDLVENLEDKVRQRTQELARINSELDEKNQALEILSLTDRLTGINNRRKLDELLRSELRRAKRYHKPFALIMVDVDHFKAVNDTYGHQVGDEVLRHIAGSLAGHARETDTVGRWGGEEFLIVCPETDQVVAENLAERLRREIVSTSFPVSWDMTASFGVTSFNPIDDVQSLMLRADQALYRAKLNGRNRVEAA